MGTASLFTGNAITTMTVETTLMSKIAVSERNEPLGKVRLNLRKTIAAYSSLHGQLLVKNSRVHSRLSKRRTRWDCRHAMYTSQNVSLVQSTGKNPDQTELNIVLRLKDAVGHLVTPMRSDLNLLFLLSRRYVEGGGGLIHQHNEIHEMSCTGHKMLKYKQTLS